MRKYKVAITQVWTFSTEVSARNREEADIMAGEIAGDLMPEDMMFGDDYVEVWEVKDA